MSWKLHEIFINIKINHLKILCICEESGKYFLNKNIHNTSIYTYIYNTLSSRYNTK